MQELSGEIWGQAANLGGAVACVKAYRGRLPAGRNGVEFTTGIAPTQGSGTPYEARWYAGTPGVAFNAQGFAVIKVKVTRRIP